MVGVKGTVSPIVLAETIRDTKARDIHRDKKVSDAIVVAFAEANVVEGGGWDTRDAMKATATKLLRCYVCKSIGLRMHPRRILHVSKNF